MAGNKTDLVVRTHPEIWRELMRHLNNNSVNINDLSKNFLTLKTNSTRVDFVYDILNQYALFPPLMKDEKDDEISAKLRQKGNEMFKIKNNKAAWEFYTKSVAFAKQGSKNLGLAYANRSAVLLEENLLKECLVDINNAILNNYPEELKNKIIVRKNNCENKLKNSTKIISWHEAIPELEQTHQRIKNAADCIEIKNNEIFGRHIIATRDIKIGEIIAVDKPFTTLLINQKYNHCHECLTLCYNLIPCNNCTQAFYCSIECKDTAQSYHKYECRILLTLNKLEITNLKLIPLKIALISNERCEENEVMRDRKLRNEQSIVDAIPDHNDLITNFEKRSITDLFNRAMTSSLIYYLVKNNTNYFDDHIEDQFKDLIFLHQQTGPSNFHQITELCDSGEGVYQSEEIATGVYCFLSLLNHSCSPNVTRFSHGSNLLLIAIRSIKKGDQLYDNYGYHHVLMTKDERQKQLKEQYFFECSCEACVKDWSTYDQLKLIHEIDYVNEFTINKLSAADLETAKEEIPKIIQHMENLEPSFPCQDFYKLQEFLKQCFCILGNKRYIF